MQLILFSAIYWLFDAFHHFYERRHQLLLFKIGCVITKSLGIGWYNTLDTTTTPNGLQRWTYFDCLHQILAALVLLLFIAKEFS